jgi:hypothetical protein
MTPLLSTELIFVDCQSDEPCMLVACTEDELYPMRVKNLGHGDVNDLNEAEIRSLKKYCTDVLTALAREKANGKSV